MAVTPLLAFRCPQALKAEIDRAINRHNANPGARDSLNFTSFMLRALKEKIQHLERSRKKIKRAKTAGKLVAVGKNCNLPTMLCKCEPPCKQVYREVTS